jgi:hypothetical protein
MQVKIQTHEDLIVCDNVNNVFLESTSGRLVVRNSEGNTVLCVNTGHWVWYGIYQQLEFEGNSREPEN